jgi:hypothetical protein
MEEPQRRSGYFTLASKGEKAIQIKNPSRVFVMGF